MNIYEYFDEFIDYLSSEKDVSYYTKRNYRGDFKTFTDFLTMIGIQADLETITTPLLRKYLAYIKNEKNFKTNTMRRKIHSLSSFYKFLMEQEYISKNPMIPIHAPKKPQLIPVYL